MRPVVVTVLIFLLLVKSALAVDPYDRTDAWEHPNLVSVVPSSIFGEMGKIFDVRDVFGGFFSTQEAGSGHFAFSDKTSDPMLRTNTVEWVMERNVPLIGYKAAFSMDVALRGCSFFQLKGWDSTKNEWVIVDNFVPLYITGDPNNATKHGFPVSETARTLTNMFVGRRFLAEIVNNPGNLGTRIIELDAVSAPNPAPILDILSPTTHLEYEYPGVIPISYKASDPNGIDRVEIFANDNPLFTGSAEDSLTWTNTSSGPFRLKFRAVDNYGGVSTNEITGTVKEPPSIVTIENFRDSGGILSFTVTGTRFGRVVFVETSPDLINWTEVDSVEATDTSWYYERTKDAVDKLFFRTGVR